MKEQILTSLYHIQKEKAVQILFAVESGSRAWGFASPDSDWDVRFVYARPIRDYVRLKLIPDHLDYQDKENDIDCTGWDIRKALSLLLNGNHAIREWIRSPIVYVNFEDSIAKFSAIAERTHVKTRLMYSYRHILIKCIRDYLDLATEQVNLKKYFYGIRSTLVMKWLESNEGFVPPIELHQLLTEVDISNEVLQEIEHLLELKQKSSELGLGARLKAVDEMLFEYSGKLGENADPKHSQVLLDQVDELVYTITKRA
jgi:predicted nucleotidyltransferase